MSNKRNVTIPKNQEKPVAIEYMPMCLETTSCNIVFIDENVGEMVYKIELTVDPPLHESESLD